jgi:hypothetical protein
LKSSGIFILIPKPILSKPISAACAVKGHGFAKHYVAGCCSLKQAYKNQDEQVHIAVLQQFPKISIGILQTKNNSAYYTLGAGVSVTLSVFDQNQGQIALAVATRQQLFDEYTNLVFQSQADIALEIATENYQ